MSRKKNAVIQSHFRTRRSRRLRRRMLWRISWRLSYQTCERIQKSYWIWAMDSKVKRKIEGMRIARNTINICISDWRNSSATWKRASITINSWRCYWATRNMVMYSRYSYLNPQRNGWFTRKLRTSTRIRKCSPFSRNRLKIRISSINFAFSRGIVVQRFGRRKPLSLVLRLQGDPRLI